MPVPTITAGARAEAAAAALTVTPVNPTHATNDILVCRGTGNVSQTLSISAGWTAFASSGDTNPLNAVVNPNGWWWKRAASGAEAAPTVTSTVAANATTNLIAAQVYAIKGCITSGTPYDVAEFNGAAANVTSTTPASIALTALGDERLLVHWIFIGDNLAMTGYPPAGYTSLHNDLSTNGADGTFATAHRGMAGQRAEPAVTLGTITSFAWRVMSASFIPADPMPPRILMPFQTAPGR